MLPTPASLRILLALPLSTRIGILSVRMLPLRWAWQLYFAIIGLSLSRQPITGQLASSHPARPDWFGNTGTSAPGRVCAERRLPRPILAGILLFALINPFFEAAGQCAPRGSTRLFSFSLIICGVSLLAGFPPDTDPYLASFIMGVCEAGLVRLIYPILSHIGRHLHGYPATYGSVGFSITLGPNRLNGRVLLSAVRARYFPRTQSTLAW